MAVVDLKAKYIRRLAHEGIESLDFFRSLTADEWEVQVYQAGDGWHVYQVLAHLLNAEQGFHHILADIISGGPGATENLDIDRLNEQQVQGMASADTTRTLEALSRARLTTIEIVRGMEPEDFQRIGRHPYLGMTTIEKIIQLIYRHVMLHQRDIRRALESGIPADSPREHNPRQ